MIWALVVETERHDEHQEHSDRDVFLLNFFEYTRTVGTTDPMWSLEKHTE